jgi:hypothetical protein
MRKGILEDKKTKESDQDFKEVGPERGRSVGLAEGKEKNRVSRLRKENTACHKPKEACL